MTRTVRVARRRRAARRRRRSALSPTKAEVAPRCRTPRAAGATSPRACRCAMTSCFVSRSYPSAAASSASVGTRWARSASSEASGIGSPSSFSASASQSQSLRHVVNFDRAEKSADISADAYRLVSGFSYWSITESLNGSLLDLVVCGKAELLRLVVSADVAKRARDALLLVVLEEVARRVAVETDDEVDFLAHGAISAGVQVSIPAAARAASSRPAMTLCV